VLDFGKLNTHFNYLALCVFMLIATTQAVEASAIRTVANGGLDSVIETYTSADFPGLAEVDGIATIALPFDINFFTEIKSELNLNVNGTLGTLPGYSNFEPEDQTLLDNASILSIFHADHGVTNGGEITIQNAIIDGSTAVVINWDSVRPYDDGYIEHVSDERVTYQLVIIDIDDIAGDDFDVEYNYGNIEWDHYGTFVGYSGLANANSWSLEHSLEDGSFRNTDDYPLIYTQSSISSVPGRIKMESRGGVMGDPAISIGESEPEIESLTGAIRTIANGGINSVTDTFTSANFAELNELDGSVVVPLPFDINFFNTVVSDLNLNVNGTLGTLEGYNNYDPEDQRFVDNSAILSIFHSDHGVNLGGDIFVKHAIIDGGDAFIVEWNGVRPYDEMFPEHVNDEVNTYQLVIIDIDSEFGLDFDVEFNYGSIEWDYNSAFVGFSGPSNANTWALDNSLIDNSFRNADSAPLINTQSNNSETTGRIRMESRSGVMSSPIISVGDNESGLNITIELGPEINTFITPEEFIATGTFTVSLDGHIPIVGETYKVISANSISGEFTDFDLPGLEEEAYWSTANLYINGNLDVIGYYSGALTALIDIDRNIDGLEIGPGYSITQPSTLFVDFSSYEPTAGDTIKLITANSIEYFEDVIVPGLPEGLLWDFSRLYSSGELLIKQASFNITGAIAWYDASDIGSLSLDDVATSIWLDKVGNFNLYQSAVESKPTIAYDRLNGRPTLEFDGLDQYFFSEMNPFSGDTARTVVCVVTATGGPIVSFAGESNGDGESFTLSADGILHVGGASQIDYNQSAVNSRYNIITLSAPQAATIAEVDLRLNGTRLAKSNISLPGTSIFTSDTPFRIGSDSNALVNGEIAEVILFDTELSEAQMNDIHRYLLQKYKIYVSSKSMNLNLWQ
jgi:hypothetical protein